MKIYCIPSLLQQVYSVGPYLQVRIIYSYITHIKIAASSRI